MPLELYSMTASDRQRSPGAFNRKRCDPIPVSWSRIRCAGDEMGVPGSGPSHIMILQGRGSTFRPVRETLGDASAAGSRTRRSFQLTILPFQFLWRAVQVSRTRPLAVRAPTLAHSAVTDLCLAGAHVTQCFWGTTDLRSDPTPLPPVTVRRTPEPGARPHHSYWFARSRTSGAIACSLTSSTTNLRDASHRSASPMESPGNPWAVQIAHDPLASLCRPEMGFLARWSPVRSARYSLAVPSSSASPKAALAYPVVSADPNMLRLANIIRDVPSALNPSIGSWRLSRTEAE